MGTMEDQIRKAVREEIARALGAVGAVGDSVWQDATEDSAKEIAADVLRRAMQRVARDVLANVHPALDPEHTASTPSTQPVHTITAVPERSRAACTCHRHTHVMGHDDRCGAPFCYCLSPVRARDEHTDVHASTEAPRTCPTCSHGVHESGKCTMHVYLRGVASPCPCMEWVRPEAVVRAGARVACTVCEHAPHGAGNCGYTAMCLGQVVKCACGDRAEPVACSMCAHLRHVGVCTAIRNGGACECGGPLRDGGQASTAACSCPGGHRKAVNGQCQMCGHKAHNPAGCTGRRSFE